MKRILLASVFAACASMGLSSCMNGDYDANPKGTNTGQNPLNPPGGGNNNSFNWSGTAPMSAKVDGTGWNANTGSYLPPGSGLPASVMALGPNNSAIGVMFPETIAPNTIINFDGTNNGSYTPDITSSDPNAKYNASMGSGGSLQILENDASHIKGKFYFNAKNPAGTTVNITEGYFDVTK